MGTLGLGALVTLGALSSLNARSAMSALNGLSALNTLRTRWASGLCGLVVFVHVRRNCEEGQSLDSATQVEDKPAAREAQSKDRMLTNGIVGC